MATTAPLVIELPLDLTRDRGEDPASPPEGQACVFRIPENYVELAGQPDLPSEVFLIQRLLTIARQDVVVGIEWSGRIAGRLQESASLYPLLAVVISLTGARHSIESLSQEQADALVSAARKSIARYRLTADLFSDSQIALCADNLGLSRPRDLYEAGSGTVARRENFETMMLDVISRLLGSSVESAVAFRNARALGVIVAELFENTHMHARFDLSGRPLGPNAMRGLVMKRIQLARPAGSGGQPSTVDCLEILIFDTGVGYYPSYTRQPVTVETNLTEEWKVLHNCLERHYYPELEDSRAAHKAMGLAEVLKLIQALQGRIEIRTGRLYAYRTFMSGDLQAQMEKRSSRFAHIAWPRPKMLDVAKRYIAIPSQHPTVVGSAVRVVVPLS
ncbi:hypothetical protein [uncultured Pseudacidovorax sp.]|uniref:hypothetical protein n=1 Tax=uncultured Pseudacidovorax sp. TaxID=679313 RepID=UPI0025D7B781|nr:hypothetical protein [uncultured Pseudacidovorax sp.]